MAAMDDVLQPWKYFRNFFAVVYAALFLLKIIGRRLQVKRITDELQFKHIVFGFLLMLFSFVISGLLLDLTTVGYLMQQNVRNLK